MGKSFNIVRVSTPDFHEIEYESFMNDVAKSRRLLGDQLDFGWAIPSAFRALANPLSPVAFPRKPDQDNDVFGAIAYWHSLQWLLVYRLGWSFPGKGLMEIYPALERLNFEIEEDRELGDTLQLLKELWFADGFLEHYIWWSSGVPDSYLARTPSSEWSPRLFDQREESNSFLKRTPLGLHLEPGSGHYFGSLKFESQPQFIFSQSGEGTGFIHFDSAWGWYDVLSEFAESKPDFELSVFVDGFGFMGKYKYSRETRLCYTGDHKVHLMGN